MDNFIKNLEIKNFKSIKHLTLDCKRVNVFIGKPNVGKSNILEALALLGWDYVLDGEGPFFENTIRYSDLEELFFDRSVIDKEIKVRADDIYCFLYSGKKQITFILTTEKNITGKDFWLEDVEFDKGIEQKISRDGKASEVNYKPENEDFYIRLKVEKYDFFGVKNYKEEFVSRDGGGLYRIVESNKEVRTKIVDMLMEYGLDFVISKYDKSFIIQKKQDGFVYQYPYSSIADTFQRFIFYLAAIESNKDSVLIFEEPEVHSFPPYVKELAERMIMKDDNQYFVSTHSPYLLQTFIDSLDDTQLNVYLTYYKDYQTHVKALSSEELSDIQRFGYDVFFNLKKFIPND